MLSPVVLGASVTILWLRRSSWRAVYCWYRSTPIYASPAIRHTKAMISSMTRPVLRFSSFFGSF